MKIYNSWINEAVWFEILTSLMLRDFTSLSTSAWKSDIRIRLLPKHFWSSLYLMCFLKRHLSRCWWTEGTRPCNPAHWPPGGAASQTPQQVFKGSRHVGAKRRRMSDKRVSRGSPHKQVADVEETRRGRWRRKRRAAEFDTRKRRWKGGVVGVATKEK